MFGGKGNGGGIVVVAQIRTEEKTAVGETRFYSLAFRFPPLSSEF